MWTYMVGQLVVICISGRPITHDLRTGILDIARAPLIICRKNSNGEHYIEVGAEAVCRGNDEQVMACQ